MSRPGACIFGCEGPDLGPKERAFFRESDPFGFILFARNVHDPKQIRSLTADLRESVGRDAPVLIDQEGGRVARLRPPHWLGWLPALEQMSRTEPENIARAMWIRYRLIAHELTALGIDTNCAPLADIPTAATHGVIRDRCYGFDVETVVQAAAAVAEGLLAGGVLPVLKHIPGHGRPALDSHVDAPSTGAPLADLMETDFAAFQKLAFLPLAMTAHVVYCAIDAHRCATVSPDVIGLIRSEIGFDGLLMSDDLSMSALKGSFRDRTARTLGAGCDIVLHCNGKMAEMAEIADAAGKMNARACLRAGRALGFRGGAGPVDQKALSDELQHLLN